MRLLDLDRYFKDLMEIKYKGLVVSRIPEKEFIKTTHIKPEVFEFLWLAENGTNKTIHPKLKVIEARIESQFIKFPGKFAILITGIDYLIFKNPIQEAYGIVDIV